VRAQNGPVSEGIAFLQFLDGNTDNISPKTNLFACPFNARFVRLNPLAWHSNIAMRFDLLGCETDGSQPACKYQVDSFIAVVFNLPLHSCNKE